MYFMLKLTKWIRQKYQIITSDYLPFQKKPSFPLPSLQCNLILLSANMFQLPIVLTILTFKYQGLYNTGNIKKIYVHKTFLS